MITIVSKSKLVEVTIPFKKNLDRTERMEAASKAVKDKAVFCQCRAMDQWIWRRSAGGSCSGHDAVLI